VRFQRTVFHLSFLYCSGASRVLRPAASATRRGVAVNLFSPVYLPKSLPGQPEWCGRPKVRPHPTRLHPVYPVHPVIFYPILHPHPKSRTSSQVPERIASKELTVNEFCCLNSSLHLTSVMKNVLFSAWQVCTEKPASCPMRR
jgi:hypothetical protein